MRWLYLAFLVLSLTGCLDDDGPTMKGREPEIVTQDFFEAIYIEGDIEEAKRVSTPRLDGLLDSYGNAKGVQRYLLNRYYDEVEVTVDHTSIRPFLGNPDTLRVNVLFSGYYEGDMIDDLRAVMLKQEGDRWYVDEILDDPYKSYGSN